MDTSALVPAGFIALLALLSQLVVWYTTTRPNSQRLTQLGLQNSELQAQALHLQNTAVELQQKQTSFQADADTRQQADFYRNQLPDMRAEILALRTEIIGLKNEILELRKQLVAQGVMHETDTKALTERLTTEHATALHNLEVLHVSALEKQRQLYTGAIALQKSESEKPPAERTEAAADAIKTMTEPPAAGGPDRASHPGAGR